MSRVYAIVIHVLVAALCVNGCATSSKQSISLIPLLRSLPGTTSLYASDIYDFTNKNVSYDIVDGNDTPSKAFVISYSLTYRFGATLQRSESDDRQQFLKIDELGNLVMTAVIEFGDKAITHFDPPLILVPRTLSPGEQFTCESSMRVVDLNHPDRIRESGASIRTITYVEDRQIEIPAGVFTAKYLDIQFTASLRLADARETTRMYVVPNVGVVAEETEETVTAIGLFSRQKNRTLVLSSSNTLR